MRRLGIELRSAADIGDHETVKELLTKSDLNVNEGNANGWTPLLTAAYRGHVYVVKNFLADKRTDVNLAIPSLGYTPLHVAAEFNRPLVVRELVRNKKVDLNAKSLKGRTPLWLACAKGFLAVALELISCQYILVNESDNDSVTPLLIACLMSHTPIVREILKHPLIQPSLSRVDGLSPLTTAIFHSSSEMIELLFCSKPPSLSSSFHVISTRSLLSRSHTLALLSRDQSDDKFENYEKEEWISLLKSLNSEYLTPMEIAEKKGNPDIIKLIQEYDLNDEYRTKYLESLFGEWETLSFKRDFISEKDSILIASLLSKHPQIKTVTFQRNLLNAKSLSLLGSSINNLQEFTILENSIGVEGARYLSQIIRMNSSLVKLKIEKCDIESAGSLELIKSMLSSLESLSLSIQQMKVDDLKLENTEGLDVLPIEVRRMGTQKIVDYILDLSYSKTITQNYRTKLLTIGALKSGKSSLLDCIFPLCGWLTTTEGFFGLWKEKFWFHLQGRFIFQMGNPDPNSLIRELYLDKEDWGIEFQQEEFVIEFLPKDDSNEPLKVYCEDENEWKVWKERLQRILQDYQTMDIKVRDCIVHHPAVEHLGESKLEISVWDMAWDDLSYLITDNFLSSRTIFLFVWNITEGDQGTHDLEQWFKTLALCLPIYVNQNIEKNSKQNEKKKVSKEMKRSSSVLTDRSNLEQNEIHSIEDIESQVQKENIEDLEGEMEKKEELEEVELEVKVEDDDVNREEEDDDDEDNEFIELKKDIFSIYVVGTHADEVEETGEEKKSRIEKIQQLAISCGLNHPIQIVEVSCVTMSGVSRLQTMLFKTALSQSYMGEQVPFTYDQLQQTIQELVEENQSFPIVTIPTIIQKANSKLNMKLNVNHVKRALTLFTSWGECIYFDEPEILSNTVILSPQFIHTEMIEPFFQSSINFSSPSLFASSTAHSSLCKNGVFSHSSLPKIWPKYRNYYPILIAYMEKLKISFRTPLELEKNFDSQQSVFISLLSTSPPPQLEESWPTMVSEDEFCFERILVFSEIPQELPRYLIFSLHSFIDHSLVWKSGMILEAYNSKSFIEINLLKRLCQIQIRGEDQTNMNKLMTIIIQRIQECCKMYPGLKFFESVRSTFDDNSLILLRDCVKHLDVSKTQQNLTCPTTQKILDPELLLLKSGAIDDFLHEDYNNWWNFSSEKAWTQEGEISFLPILENEQILESDLMNKFEYLMKTLKFDMKTVERVVAIKHSNFAQTFERFRAILHERHKVSPEVFKKQDWKETTSMYRQKALYIDYFEKFATSFEWNQFNDDNDDDNSIFVVPAIWKANQENIWDVCKQGFLISESEKEYGVGMYFSTTIEPSPTNKSFVIYVTLPGNVFPITEPLESQDNSINQDGYQSHFTILNQATLQPTDSSIEGEITDRLVIFEKNQVLPLFIVYVQ